jgi:hypothetical protein
MALRQKLQCRVSMSILPSVRAEPVERWYKHERTPLKSFPLREPCAELYAMLRANERKQVFYGHHMKMAFLRVWPGFEHLSGNPGGA